MAILIKNGTILNPATQTNEVLDVLITDDTITRMAPSIDADGAEVIDATGCFVAPGFIDMHVHFRDPGQTAKEDIETGSRAAAHGGYTTVCAMPNTSPVIDCPELVHYVHNKAKEVGLCNVLQVGAMTDGMKGEKLSQLEPMIEAGIPAMSEDGKSVMNTNLFREALRVAAAHQIPVLSHCEDINLVDGGVMNAGPKAEALGIRGISNAVENIIEARDIMVAEETGATLHLCHCSTKESVDLIRCGKARGVKVSGEVCPHHFTLCDEDIPSAEDSNYKMNPPLRTAEDREALRKGLSEGVLEVISTDHAPHTEEEKARGFTKAPFGIVGVETAAALTYSELVLGGYLTPMQMMEKMSYNPARILGIDKGDISEGKVADVVIFDPNQTYEIHAADFHGKSKNMPFEGRKVTGAVVATILAGRVTYRR
ncbi:MAG: dihydroorotase [Lachnospiraceae bacterium]|nr:dihydroorotase [Lachnospiraceae bacterium]